MVAIQTIINEDFLDRVGAVGRGEQRQGAALRNALLGSGEGANRIASSLRSGAQAYARALSGINFGASLLNFARSDLEQLASLTEEMKLAVGKAAAANGTRDDRLQAQRLVSNLGKDFKDILQGAEVGDRKYLSAFGLEDVFTVLGLDPLKIKEIKSDFKEFQLEDPEKLLAYRDIKGKNTELPAEYGRSHPAHDVAPLFDGSRSIRKRADAQAMLDDLEALSGQIGQNITAIDGLTETLGEHARLVRTTALAFLEVGDSLTSEADAAEVAKNLATLIRRNAREALSHAENLEPLLLATLSYKDNGIVVDGF